MAPKNQKNGSIPANGGASSDTSPRKPTPPSENSLTMREANENTKEPGKVRKDCVTFDTANGPYGFLSNFKMSPFKDGNGVEWKSGEHYFQSGKAYLVSDKVAYQKAREVKLPQSVKNQGNKIKLDPAAWNKVSKGVMLDTLWWKILSSQDDMQTLLATKECLLVECRKDFVWASGLSRKETYATPVKDWPGRNKLGECWMYIRKVLQTMKRHGEDLTTLKPEEFGVPKHYVPDPEEEVEGEEEIIAMPIQSPAQSSGNQSRSNLGDDEDINADGPEQLMVTSPVSQSSFASYMGKKRSRNDESPSVRNKKHKRNGEVLIDTPESPLLEPFADLNIKFGGAKSKEKNGKQAKAQTAAGSSSVNSTPTAKRKREPTKEKSRKRTRSSNKLPLSEEKVIESDDGITPAPTSMPTNITDPWGNPGKKPRIRIIFRK